MGLWTKIAKAIGISSGSNPSPRRAASSKKPAVRTNTPIQDARLKAGAAVTPAQRVSSASLSSVRPPAIVRPKPSDPVPRAAVPNRMSSRPADRPIRRINVGLDFGTSASKVIVRIDEGGGRPRFLIVGPSGQAGTVLFPSIVAVENGALLFGHAAQRSPSTVRAASFKMNLPAEAGSRKHEWRGRLRLGDTELTGEQVSTLYVAWVLKDVLAQVRQSLGEVDLRVTVNAAAPLDQMQEETNLREVFHRTFYRALKLHHFATAPWGLDAARAALRQADAEPIPSDAESPISVFPETHAAMTSYMLLPGRAKGIYASVDVGAGSTDVAFFWFHQPDGRLSDGPPEMCYYGAASSFVGMDDVDEAISQQAGISIATAKLKRETENSLLTHVSGASAAFAKMYECYRRGFGESYRRCKGEYEWRFRRPSETGSHYPKDGHARYTLCLVGGGCLSPDLVAKLSRTFPLQGIRSIDREVLRVPDDILVLGRGERNASIATIARGEQSLLILAHGLAHRAVDIPVFTVDQKFERVREMPDRQSHEDIYAR